MCYDHFNTSTESMYVMTCLSVLSAGKTAWNAKYTAWSDAVRRTNTYEERRLSKSTVGDMTVDKAMDLDTYDNIAIDDTPTDADSNTDIDADTDTDGVLRGDMSDSVHRRLFYSQPPWCFFEGVTCGSVSGSSTYANVMSISLDSFALYGSLPSSIGNFQSLTVFDLPDNKINGSIPSTISGMTALQYLLLSNNTLIGSIPSTISGMTALQSLDLYSNSLTGSIPSTISALTALKVLALDTNQLAGTIPSTMRTLTALQFINLDNNYLTMGTATTVPASTFSNNTLSHGEIYLDSNCLAFSYGGYSASATHCSPTSGELI